MGNVNKVILVGNLGADPEVKRTEGDRPYCHLSVATTAVFKDAVGAKQERTEWHRITAWGELAEQCGRYLAKGRRVFVEGRLEHRSWNDKDGQKRWSTNVVAQRIEFLSDGRGADEQRGDERKAA